MIELGFHLYDGVIAVAYVNIYHSGVETVCGIYGARTHAMILLGIFSSFLVLLSLSYLSSASKLYCMYGMHQLCLYKLKLFAILSFRTILLLMLQIWLLFVHLGNYILEVQYITFYYLYLLILHKIVIR